jgi:hypothetical protein
MTASENLVSRWARLKRESAAARKAKPVAAAPQVAPVVTPEVRSDPVPHRGDSVVDEAFDPASLPSIETIAADTDIRAFLHSRVPVELTRLALRRAWASDPAIRDFIGIAENQWDFNDPDAMPGFGPLRANDHLTGLLQQAFGKGDRLEQTLASSLPARCEQAQLPMPDRGPVDPDQSPGQPLVAPPSAGSDLPELAVGIAISSDRVIEASENAPNRRLHGSALPRFRT